MSANVPELRFSGFADPWEQRKLGDLYRKCTEKNDGTYNTNSIISVAGMSYSPETRVTEQSYLGTYNVMRLGDIAFEGHANRVFSHGRFVENDLGIGIVSHIFDVFRPKVEYDLSYWRYAINNESLMRNVLIRSTKASTMMHNLVTSDFLKQSIPVPTVAEQKKIGGVLVRLDSLIALHQRKHNQLSVLKGSLLEGMFPKPGSDVPELRFSGFADPWEQRKLGELFVESDDRSSELEILSVSVRGGIYPASESDRTTNPGASIANYKVVHPGDIVYNSMRMWQGAVDSSIYRGIVSPAYVVARPMGGVDSRFFARLLKRPEMLSHYQRVSQGNSKDTLALKFEQFSQIDVSMPLFPREQMAIGELFDGLDSLIALHQRKLEKLRALKQSLLQKMFV